MVSKNKSIDEQLEELTTIYERGGGFGSPGAERELERKIDLLKHKQIQAVNKRNSHMVVLNVIVMIINLGVFIYQVFFK